MSSFLAASILIEYLPQTRMHCVPRLVEFGQVVPERKRITTTTKATTTTDFIRLRGATMLVPSKCTYLSLTFGTFTYLLIF